MNKCTLLIDGNWLLISRFSVLGKLFNTKLPKEAREHATTQLQELLAKSINIMLNRFPQIDNIILITDGGTWRKQLPVPEQLRDTIYKGNREHESGFDWDAIFKALNKLSNRFTELGITYSMQSNCEGDDWVWYWSRRLNANKINCIIWSSDNDLKQLVQNKEGIFTAWYNDKNGLFFHNSLQEHEVDSNDPNFLDVFMKPIVMRSPLMESLIQRTNSCNYIDPNTIITGKVICGDSGDNIKSVIRVSKGGRIYGVGMKDWEKISNQLNIKTIQDLIQAKDEIAHKLVHIKKFLPYNLNPNDVEEMINYNIKLVWLNEDIIPESVVDVMNNMEYRQCDMNYIRGSYKVLCEEDNEIKNLFEVF